MEEVYIPVGLFGGDSSERLNGSYYGGTSALPGNPVVAMAYVPLQLDTTQYEVEEALMHGTLFKALNKPFLGANK